MSSRTALILLMLIVAAHVALAVWHAAITPWRTGGMVMLNRSVERDIGAPDERQHANYVIGLARGAGLPVFDPKDPSLYENYQSHQPPAYYLLATAWSRLLGADVALDAEDRSVGFKLRLLNALIGAALVVGVFFLGYWGFGSREIGLTAAAFAGLLPMMVALCGAVSNDPLLFALCTWVLALCALSLKQGWTWRRAVLVGVLTGVALVTKTTAVSLLPILLLALVLPQKQRPKLAMVGAAVLLALALAVPWWVRNQNLYGDPLAMKAFTDAFQGSAQKSAIVQGIAASGDPSPEMTYWKDWVGWWTARSFFGVFGYMDIWLNETGRAMGATPNTLYRLLIVFVLLCAIGWVLGSASAPVRERWPTQVLNAVFLLIVVLLFVRFNNQYFQAQARYLLPAIGPIACGVGIGLTFLLRKRQSVAVAIVAALFLGINLYALGRLPGEFERRIELGKQSWR